MVAAGYVVAIAIFAIAGTSLAGMAYLTGEEQNLRDIATEVQARQTDVADIQVEGRFTSLSATRDISDADAINGTVNIVNTGDTPVDIVQIRVYDEYTGDLVDVIPVFISVPNYGHVDFDLNEPQYASIKQWLLCEQTGEGRHPLFSVDYQNDPVPAMSPCQFPAQPAGIDDYYNELIWGIAEDRMPGGAHYNEQMYNISKAYAYCLFNGNDGLPVSHPSDQNDGVICVPPRPDTR